ncbi:hypothetical protein AgCh_020488 [Apium graveolens]
MSKESSSESIQKINYKGKDPLGALQDWNDSSHHCNWSEIMCDPFVVSISPFLGNLSNLQLLDLTLNSFTPHILPQLG